jgi:hypothetical protein
LYGHIILTIKILKHTQVLIGRDSSIGIKSLYVLHGPGIESRCGKGFKHQSRQNLAPTKPPIKMVPYPFPEVNQRKRGVKHPPSSLVKVKERVELYLYFSIWTFIICSRANVTYFFFWPLALHRYWCTVFIGFVRFLKKPVFFDKYS